MSMYKYIVLDDKVICLSTYGHKPVKGVAKCAPGDAFDPEYGRRLAKARCDVKVARKRYARACEKYDEADRKAVEAERYAEKMADYLDNSDEALYDAETILGAVLAEKFIPMDTTTDGDAFTGEDE